MKQTNNAIKFLMAQYRAVFKRAFLSNLGLAVAVTAGLTAGAANADEPAISQDPNNLIDYTFTNDTHNSNVTVSGGNYAASLTIDSITLTLTGNYTKPKDSRQIKRYDIFVRDNMVAKNAEISITKGGIQGIIPKDISDNGQIPNTDSVWDNINSTFSATNTKITLGGKDSSIQFGDLTIDGGSGVTLQGQNSGISAIAAEQENPTNGNLTIKNVKKTTGTNETKGIVLSGSGSYLTGYKIDISNSDIFFNESNNLIVAKASEANNTPKFENTLLKLKDSTLTIAESKTGASLQGATINIEGTDINVKSGGALSLKGNKDNSKTSNITLTKANINNSGTVTVYGKMVVDAGSTLKSVSGASFEVDGQDKKGTDGLDDETLGTIEFAKGSILKSYLDGKGNFVTKSGATVIFQDNTDLHEFAFSGSNSGVSGTFVVSGDTVIKGQSLTVSDKLGLTDTNSKLTLSTDNLTLGSTSYTNGEVGNGEDFGFKSASTKNIEFKTSKDSFILKNSINLTSITDQYGKDLVVGESGSITGDVTVATDGQINVKGGFYTADQITASGGKVSVQDPTLKSGALKSDIQSSLTINNLSLGTADNSEISASGKHSSLTIGELSFIEDSKGVIKADHGAVVNLDADFVQEVLNQAAKANNGSGSKNIQFTAANTGTLNINGDITLDFTSNNSDALDEVIHFASGNAGQAGNVIAKSVTINGKGIPSDQLFYQGVGKLYVQDLSLNAYDENNAVIKDAVATLSNGHYYITNSLNSANANSNGKLKLSSTNSNIGSKLFLGDVKEVLGADSQVKYYEATSNSGNVNIDLIVDQNAELNVKTGAWDAQAIDVTSGKVTVGALNSGGVTYKNVDGNDITASLTGTKLTMTGGNLDINSTGAATFTAVETTGGLVTVNGEMTINGGAVTEEDKTNEIKLGSGTVKVNQNGELVIRDAALTNSFFGTDYAVKDNVKNGISVGSNGIVKLDFAGGEISLDQLKQIKTDLFGATNGQIDGVLNIGKAQIGGLKFENDNTITWDNLKPVSDVSSDVTNEKLLGAKVTGVDSPFKSHVGSIDSKNQRVEINGNSSLNNAADNGGMFASYNGEVANVNITNGSDLTLRNEGSIGEITLKGAVDDQAHLYTDGVGKVTIANVSGDSGSSFSANTETLVTKDVKAGEVGVDANGSLEVQGKLTATNDLYNEGKLAVVGDAKVEKDFSTSGQASFENSLTVSGTADVFGNTTVNAKATFNSDVNIGGDATLKADEIVLDNFNGPGVDNVFAVGQDNYEFNGETVEGSTGYLEANSFKLAGNTLIVDPAYGKKTSIAAIKSFTTNNNKVEYAGIVNGKLIVGQNAALMLGKDASIAKMQEFIAQYQDGNGSLQADNVGSVVYLTDKLTLNDGSRVILDSERSHSDILGTEANIGSLYDNTYKAQFNGTGTDLEADLYIGSNTVLAAGDKILTQGGAIHFDMTDASIMAGGDGSGKVVLVGDGFMNSRNITLFTDNGDGTTNSEGVKVLGTNDIRVESLNGLMYFDLKAGTETTGGTLELDISKTRNAFLGASAPMRDFLIAYASKTNNWSEYYRDTTNVARDYLVDTVASPDLATWDKDTNTITLSNEAKKMGLTENDFVILNDGTAKEALYRMAHNSFLERVVRNSNGAAADQASRMGVFGGAAQAALSSAAASYEAISGRFGVGLNYNLTAANNGQGAGMWVSPIYKSYDSDGFATQGQNYGADVDLYGVALGGDYTMSNGLRFGAMFNVGGGDADGNGFAAGISNDFNYYGFGLYAGYAYDKFSVVADITYTVVDSDVDANTDIEKVSTSFDTDSLSLGVTGQYKLDLNGMSVTPHAGLRFTRLDMDSYNINGTDGKIGEFDTSSANVFSVPVGVTFAKEFQGEEWSVQPSFDLTLTGNFGDDDLDGSVRWTGVSRTVSSNTEFIDSFTYGATVGLSATNGNFSFGAGLNYTGSSNTDEFGINATARFLF